MSIVVNVLTTTPRANYHSSMGKMLAAAALVATLIGSASPAAAAPADNVLYLVNSDEPISAISWRDSLGDSRQDVSGGMQWYWTFTNADDRPYFVTATSAGTVHCQLLVNANLMAEDTQHGGTATCAH